MCEEVGILPWVCATFSGDHNYVLALIITLLVFGVSMNVDVMGVATYV